MLGCLPPTKGISPYILGLVRGLSNECEIDFYGFKSIYPEKLYPGGTKTNESEPKIKNVKITEINIIILRISIIFFILFNFSINKTK